ncbi:flavin reductase family protein [Enorma phocaeensis]|uniref:flavin reductase family protein n=1 Tax=Enorma phocaeensis TaxID=1871019 RepID=UPI0023563086|nr:flavin reductase family protein [Enorma phocaeensis]
MKRNIGSKPALYPMPVIVVGAMDGDEPTWTLVAHTGIPSHGKIMVSLAAVHFINGCIKQTGALSVNVVDESWLDRADFCGSVSGARESKAEAFAWTAGEAGAPLVDDAKLSMECRVEDVYEVDRFENFVCSVAGTYADDAVLTEDGKVDVAALRPVLFEMPTYTYLRTGEKIADCLSFSRVRAAEAANE